MAMPMNSRGPDARELAFDREQRALLRAYAHDEQTKPIFDELLAAQAQVLEQGEQPRQPHFGALKESWQMRRGEAFWDREPADPVPLRAVE
jgi:hypothetical protein